MPNRFLLAHPPRDCRARLTVASVLVAAALALAACGGGGQEEADPATIAPPGSLVYFSATVRPEGDQREAIDELSRKVLKISDPGQRIQRELDENFRKDPESRDVTYADDIAPWLGRRAGAAITRLGPGEPEFAIIIASQDNAAAQEGIEREAQSSTPKWSERSYKGVDYFYDPEDRAGHGVVGDFAVVASEPAFKATVDASEGDSGLAGKPDFETAVAGNEDKLGFGYIDVKALIAAANASGQLPPGSGAQLQSLLGSGAQPATLSLDAQPDRVTFESVARGVQGAGSHRHSAGGGAARRLVAGPRCATGRASSCGAPRPSSAEVWARECCRWCASSFWRKRAWTSTATCCPPLGDVAVFVRGSNLLTIGGGIVIQTPDPAAARASGEPSSRRLVSRQGAAMGLRVARTTIGGARGYRISSARIPGSVNVVAGRDRMVIAYGDSATTRCAGPAGPARGHPRLQDRAGVDRRAAPAAVHAVRAGGPADGHLLRPRGARRPGSYLNALNTLAAGSRVEGDRQTGRMVITVK